MPGEGGGVPQGKRGKCSQQDAGASPHLTHRASLSALLPRVPGRPRLLVCWFLLHQACTRREPSEPSPRQGHPLPRATLPRCAGTERRRGGGRPQAQTPLLGEPPRGLSGAGAGLRRPHPHREPRADTNPLVSGPSARPCPHRSGQNWVSADTPAPAQRRSARWPKRRLPGTLAEPESGAKSG